MKRMLAGIFAALILSGCSSSESEMDKVLNLRSRLQSSSFTFDSVVTADYLDKVYSFAMKCEVNESGELTFQVTSPETLAGISGNVSNDGGKFTFDDRVLLFETIADGLITPVTSPWVVIKSLRSGYIRSTGKEGSGTHIQLNDSYNEEALYLDVWTDQDDLPETAEIYWEGRRILSLEIENFNFL